LLKYAITAGLIFWLRPRQKIILGLVTLFVLFHIFGWIYDELRHIYPPQDHEDLLIFYAIKLTLQLSTIGIGAYLLFGLLRFNTARSTLTDTPRIQSEPSKKTWAIETRTEALIKKRKDQKSEKNNQ